MSFSSRADYKNQAKLEEARKAWLIPPEIDEDGREINPHIPQYMSSAPWYAINPEKPGLKHQENWKSKPKNSAKRSPKRDFNVFRAEVYRQGACANCGAMTHARKFCVERPRKTGAKWTGKFIAADEKIECLELDYDGKRDRWNGYDPSEYRSVIEFHEARDEARMQYKKEQDLKKMDEEDEDKNNVSDVHKYEDEEEEEEAKIDESEQVQFSKVNKRVRTTNGGSTCTVRSLRIREDTAKYLINLDLNSAYYDPKSRSMREDPLPDANPDEKFYCGDNFHGNSGRDHEMIKELEVFSLMGRKIHGMETIAPSQAELLYQNLKKKKEMVRGQLKKQVIEKYGNVACKEEMAMELLLGQTEVQVEYDKAGNAIRGKECYVAKSKYEEDVVINNHTSVWGSWWNEHKWGYKCCRQTIKNSYCIGQIGIEAEMTSSN